jgi:hypothetical protein
MLKEESILPEKKVFVLTPLGYYSVTSTVLKSLEHSIDVRTVERTPFKIKKEPNEEFDVPHEVKDTYDIALNNRVTDISKYADMGPIISKEKSAISDDKKRDLIRDLNTWFPPIVSIKDKTNISVFMRKDMVEAIVKEKPEVKNKYEQTPLIFYKKKDDLKLGNTVIISFIVFDDDNIPSIMYFIIGKLTPNFMPLIDFNPDNQLIVVNYKKQIEIYISADDYAGLTPEEKTKYDDSKPHIFYKKRTNEELRSSRDSSLVNDIKKQNEVYKYYQELLKDFNDDNSKIIGEYEIVSENYKEHPEFIAIRKLTESPDVKAIYPYILWKETYLYDGKVYLQLFEDENAYIDFLKEQVIEIDENREHRKPSQKLKGDLTKIYKSAAYRKKVEDKKLQEEKDKKKQTLTRQGTDRKLRLTIRQNRSSGGGSKNKTRKLYPSRNILLI